MSQRSMNPGGGETAKAIGLKIAQAVGLQPTEVIE